MYPILFHLGPILIPAYGAFTAVGVLLALFLAERTARCYFSLSSGATLRDAARCWAARSMGRS